jgi:hypothetical protein
VVDHYRERKTGPKLALAVARFRVHLHAFTLYPAGHVPYGRRAVAPAAPDGSVLWRGDAERGQDAPAWETTVFEAGLDARRGLRWSRSSPSKDSRRRRTQDRMLVLGATLLGLAEMDSGTRERIAERLGVACLEVLDRARGYRWAQTFRVQGRLIVESLERLPVRRSLCDDLLVCGAIAGLWGRPSRWDPGGPAGGVLRPLF